MFTGIVARIVNLEEWRPQQNGRRLVIANSPVAASDGDLKPWGDLVAGESIAVNGVCLTVVESDLETLSFDVIPETLEASAIGDLPEGISVNLERALRVGDRFGGHYVLGHVDGIGRVTEVRPADGETVLRIEVESDRGFRVIEKGSVAIDGVSLTVVDCTPTSFSVALIPHTLEVTGLGMRQVGDRVNLEMDHIGKWVMTLLEDQ